MPVAIVNETLARRFWGSGQDAVGKRVRVAAGEWRTVIGVARDVKYSRVNEAPRPYVYLPFLQTSRSAMMLHARGSAGAAAAIDRVRAHIQAIDPELPIRRRQAAQRSGADDAAVPGNGRGGPVHLRRAGMALAAMGIYGLVSYAVKQSTHEIGIRIALGARSIEVVWQFLRRGLRLGAIGAALGTVARARPDAAARRRALRRERDRPRLVRRRPAARPRRRRRGDDHSRLARRSDASADGAAPAVEAGLSEPRLDESASLTAGLKTRPLHCP